MIQLFSTCNNSTICRRVFNPFFVPFTQAILSHSSSNTNYLLLYLGFPNIHSFERQIVYLYCDSQMFLFSKMITLKNLVLKSASLEIWCAFMHCNCCCVDWHWVACWLTPSCASALHALTSAHNCCWYFGFNWHAQVSVGTDESRELQTESLTIILQFFIQLFITRKMSIGFKFLHCSQEVLEAADTVLIPARAWGWMMCAFGCGIRQIPGYGLIWIFG